MIAGHEPRHAYERAAGHQLRSDYVVFTERIIFRQDGDEVHPVARDGEPGRIDRRLGNADIVAPRGKHAAHHIGVANEEFDFDVGALFGKGGNDGGQQRYTRHRMARNRQRSDLASADLLGNSAQIVDFRRASVRPRRGRQWLPRSGAPGCLSGRRGRSRHRTQAAQSVRSPPAGLDRGTQPRGSWNRCPGRCGTLQGDEDQSA